MHIIRQHVVKPIAEKEKKRCQDSDDLSQHCEFVTGTCALAHRFHFYRQPGVRSSISLTPPPFKGRLLEPMGHHERGSAHRSIYAGAKLTGFIGEPSSPPTMCVFEGAKKHSVPFSSSTALRCTLFLTA
jgi:hypothetical protein